MALCVLVCVAFPSAAAAPNLTRWATEGLPEYQYDGPLTEPRGVEQKQPRATHETETKHGGGCSVERMRRYNALAEKINGLLDLMRDHEPDPTGVNGGNSPCGTPSAPWEIKMSAPDAPSRYAAARDAYEYAAAMYNATRRPVPTSTSPHAANIRFLREFDNPKSPVEIETVYDQLLRGTRASGGLQNSITRPSQHNSTTPYQQQNEPLYHLTKHDGVAAAAPIPPEGTKERRDSDSGRDSVSIPSESVSPRPSDTHAVPCDAVSTTPCVSSARAHRKMTIRWLQNQIAAKIHALTPASTSTDPSPNPNPDPNPDPNHGPASTNSDAVGSASESQSQTINLKNSNGCKECEMPSVKDIECASQKFRAMAAAVTAAQKLENLQRQLNDQVAKKMSEGVGALVPPCAPQRSPELEKLLCRYKRVSDSLLDGHPCSISEEIDVKRPSAAAACAMSKAIDALKDADIACPGGRGGGSGEVSEQTDGGECCTEQKNGSEAKDRGGGAENTK